MPYEYIRPITIKKSDDIFDLIQGKCSKYCPDLRENYIFRGLESLNYDLIPSSLRQEAKNGKIINKIDEFGDYAHFPNDSINQCLKETIILKEFLNLADKSGLKVPNNDKIRIIMHNIADNSLIQDLLHHKTWPVDEYFEIISLAQHYGLPTIALDWSYNYKISLYFATIGYLGEKKEEDCVLWALNYQMFEKYFSKEENRQRFYNFPLYIYRPEYHINHFMTAQKGLFTFWKEEAGESKINRKPLDKKIEDLMNVNNKFLEQMKEELIADNIKLMYKFIIPSKTKEKILKELNIEGYTEEYIYPGYSGVVSSIKNSKKLNKKYQKNIFPINSNKESTQEMIENNKFKKMIEL